MDTDDLNYVYEPHTATEQTDYENAARKVLDDYKRIGDTLDQLEDRYQWIEDPTVSDFSAAYCAGYLSQLRNLRTAETFRQILDEETR